jgi:hypothetical protein
MELFAKKPVPDKSEPVNENLLWVDSLLKKNQVTNSKFQIPNPLPNFLFGFWFLGFWFLGIWFLGIW